MLQEEEGSGSLEGKTLNYARQEERPLDGVKNTDNISAEPSTFTETNASYERAPCEKESANPLHLISACLFDIQYIPMVACRNVSMFILI